MNILHLPILLVYRMLPKQSNDLSFGLIQRENIPSFLEKKDWLGFERIVRKQSPENLTKLIDGLCLTGRYDDLIKLYIQEHNSEIVNLISGVCNTHIAWKIRTGSWAEEVKTDQWKGFFEYLGKAEACLENVTESSSLQTEANARLIRVYMGLSRKHDAIDVFNQCRNADANHFLAYSNMFKLLTPKWSGSDKELKELIHSVQDVLLKQMLEVMYFIEVYSDLFYEDEDKAKRIFQAHYLTDIKRVLNSEFNLPKDSIVSIYTCNYLAYLYHILGKRRSRNKVLKKIGSNFTQYPWAYFGMHSERDVKVFKTIGAM